MSEPTNEEKENTKQRMRHALDVLQNYTTVDGRIDATKLTSEIERLQARDIALMARIREFDVCIRRVATELDAVCCGGVDGDQSDPHSTTAVLVEEIRRLKRRAGR